MKLQSLQLYDFRSYETASVQLHPGVNLIVGENAQGKTNLLESVFYLSTGKSFRTARNQELIRFGAEFADLSCTLFSGGREQSLRAVLFSGRRPRQLYIGGVKQRSAAGLSGVLTTVLFCPDDLLILKSGSAGRRKILDTALCQLRPGYAQALAEYQKLYDSKSRILKDYHDAPSLLEPLPEFNYRMAQVGAVVIAYRAKFLRELSKQARLYHAEFSGGREELSLVYQTVSTVTDPFADKKTIFQQLLDHQQAHYRAARRLSVSSWPSANYSAPTPARSRFCCWTTCCPSWTRGGRILCSIRSVPGRCSSPAVSRNASRISANAFLWRADRSGRKRHVPEYRRRFFRPVGIRRGRV